MVRATSASYPGGATGSWTNSPYSRRRVTAAMDGSELLVAMTGSRPKWVMAGSWLSVRTQMGSGSGTAVVQRTAPTSTVNGWDARPRPPDRGHLAQQPWERAEGRWDWEGARVQFEAALASGEAALGPTTRPWPSTAATSAAYCRPFRRRRPER